MRVPRIFPLIGIALFVTIIWNIDVSKTLETIAGTNVPLLLLSMSMLFPILMLKTYKWKLLLKACGKDAPVASLVRAWLAGYSIGIVTPGKSGELIRACYIRGLALGKSLTTVIIDRISDILVLFCFALCGLAFFTGPYLGNTQLLYPIVVLFAAFAALTYALYRQHLTKKLLRPLFRHLVPERHKPGISRVFADLYRGVDLLGKRKDLLIASTIAGILSWLIVILQFYLLSLAMHMGIPYFWLLFIIPIVMILDALPISFSGIGTREGGLIFIFSFISLPAEAAVSYSLMMLFSSNLVLGVLGMIFWLKEPIELKL